MEGLAHCHRLRLADGGGCHLPRCLTLKKVDTKVNKNGEKQKETEENQSRRKNGAVRLHYLEGVSQSELARIPIRPNQIWVSDITYVPIEDETARLGYRFCFLTLIKDAYSKRVLGSCVAPTLEAEYSIVALKESKFINPSTWISRKTLK